MASNQLRPRPALVDTHVLVVENDPEARALLRTVLEYAGALVTVADSAPAAVAVIRRIVPDVAVAASGMPGLSWLLDEIQRLSATRGVCLPVIALTTPESVYDMEMAGTDGFRARLAMPVDPRELSRVVAALVRRPDVGRRGRSA